MTPADLITDLGEHLDDIEDHTEHLADTDYQALAHWTAHLAHVHRELGHLARAAQHTLAEIMPEPEIQVDGVTFIRRNGSKRKAWDWDMLLPTLTRMHVDPDGTGELPEPAELVDRLTGMVRDTIGVTPSKGPRVTALRELGLDPDEWCETTPGPDTVQMTGVPGGTPGAPSEAVS